MISPCVNVCQLQNDVCMGCRRHIDDIAQWSKMSDLEQQQWWVEHPQYYAGIGSRTTPQSQLERIQKLSRHLDRMQWTLRSGGARGADTYFEQSSTKKDIFLPTPKRGNTGRSLADIPKHIILQAQHIGRNFHPQWDGFEEYTLKLMTRNVFQVLGVDLKSPVEFVLFWAPAYFDSETRVKDAKGGTGFAVRLARALGIPLAHVDHPSTQHILLAIENEDPKSLYQGLQGLKTTPTFDLSPIIHPCEPCEVTHSDLKRGFSGRWRR